MRCLLSRGAKKLIEAKFGGDRGQQSKRLNGSIVICIVSDTYNNFFGDCCLSATRLVWNRFNSKLGGATLTENIMFVAPKGAEGRAVKCGGRVRRFG
jgi:hypothetical protein